MDALHASGNGYLYSGGVSVAGPAEAFSVEHFIVASDPVFAGHFPHLPIYPGVLLLDLMQRAVKHHAAQVLGLDVVLSKVVRASFHLPVFPDTPLIVTGTCAAPDSAVLRAQVRIESDALVANARLDFAVIVRAD